VKEDEKRLEAQGPFSWRWLLVCAGLLLVAVSLRAAFLTADPPLGLCWSKGWWLTDEGAYIISARNFALFGEYQFEGKRWPWDVAYYHPIWNWIIYAAYKVAGVGLAQARSVTLLCSFVFMLALWRLGVVVGGGARGFFSLLFAGLSYVVIMHNRVATVETLILALMTSGLYAAFASEKRPIWGLLSGILLTTEAIAKIPSVFAWGVGFVWMLCPAVLPGWKARASAEAKRFRPLLWYLTGSSLVAGLVFLFWYAPNWSSIVSMTEEFGLTGHVVPSSPSGVVKRMVTFFPGAGLFVKMPLVSILAFSYVTVVLFSWFKRARGERFLVLWLVAGCAYFSVWNYRPLRYELLVAPPLCLLAGIALARFAANYSPSSSQDSSGGAWGTRRRILWALVWAASMLIVFSPLRREFGFSRSLFLVAGGAVAVAAVAGALFFVPRLPGRKVRLALAALGIVLFIGYEGYRYRQWASQRQYTVVNVSRELDAALPEGSIVFGRHVSTEVAFEHRFPVYLWLVHWHSEGLRTLLARTGATHVVCGQSEIDACPDVFAGFEKLRSFRAGDWDISLFRVR
jgi:4-amino-4-deoxy-L-arabinose transferase-like glycosyltransferase